MKIGYSKELIGTVNKAAGMIATVAGTLVGGSLMIKFGLKRALVNLFEKTAAENSVDFERRANNFLRQIRV